jgi:hypothetical protein
MEGKLIRLGLCLLAFSVSAAAQTVPLFSGSTYSGPSEITQSNGNVGIATTSPSAQLEVNGLSRFDTGAMVGGGGSGLTGYKNLYLWGSNYSDAVTNGAIGGAVTFDGANYIGGTDGGSSGGWIMRGTWLGDTIGFYTIPSTGGTVQKLVL